MPPAPVPSPSSDPHPEWPDSYQLTQAPMVPMTSGPPVTVHEYLRRYHPKGEKTLMWVVMEMYRRAAGVPEVAAYFHSADLTESGLPRHFHAVLSVITKNGVTVGLARQMGNAHTHVHNGAGSPITPGIYDAVVNVLAGILAEQKLPEVTLDQVADAAGALREYIAVGSVPVAT